MSAIILRQLRGTGLLPLLLSVLLLGGCTSFQTETSAGGLAGVQRFFVVRNLSDNRALDRHIAAALQARGFVAETGPLTMMPGDTQAIVTFQDHWNWDFGEHLYYLKLTVRKPESSEPLATVTYSVRIPRKETTAETVAHLVGRLFGDTAPARVTVVEKPRA